MRVRRIAAITVAGLAAAGGAGAAIAATAGDDPKQAEDAVLKDAADELNVSPGRLRDALRDATAAQLARRLDRAVNAGRLTKEQADEIKSRHARSDRVLGLGPGPGLGPRVHGFHRGPGFPGGPGPRGGPLADVAKALGISRAKLFSELRAGKTIAEIAKSQGKTLDEVKKAVLAAAKARFDRAVRGGDLTETQAEAMLEHLEDHLDHFDSVRPIGPPPGPGGPFGPPDGMRR